MPCAGPAGGGRSGSRAPLLHERELADLAVQGLAADLEHLRGARHVYFTERAGAAGWSTGSSAQGAATAANGALVANSWLLFIGFWGLVLVTLFLLTTIGSADAEPGKVKAAAGKSMVILGAADLALILGVGAAFLATSTPEEIAGRVREYCRIGARRGRFALYLCNIGPTTPPANLRAAVDAAHSIDPTVLPG